MRHVREVLRLKTAGVPGNEIARRLNLAPSTVRLTLQRLATAELVWPLPAEMTDTLLEARLFTAVGTKQGHRRHAEPDWAEVHRELKRKHVTLAMLWDEYIERCPDGWAKSSRNTEQHQIELTGDIVPDSRTTSPAISISEDEIDDLVLDAGTGGAIFNGQFAIKLDRISKRSTDQRCVFGGSRHHYDLVISQGVPIGNTGAPC